jgi:hypothetical protein
LPVWRPAGGCSNGDRFPGHGTSEPHGQTVQEATDFRCPMHRLSHALSAVGQIVQQPVSRCVGSPHRRFCRSLSKLPHSAGGLRSHVCFVEHRSPQPRLQGCFIERRCSATHLSVHRINTRRSPQSALNRSLHRAKTLDSVSLESLRQCALLSAGAILAHAGSTSALSTDSIRPAVSTSRADVMRTQYHDGDVGSKAEISSCRQRNEFRLP